MVDDGDLASEEDVARVLRTRLTYLATRVHDKLPEIGEPEAFAERFVTRDPVGGLTVGLPFGPESPTDTDFWRGLAEETSLSDAIPINVARRLRRAGVPLRYQGGLEIEAVHKPRLEAHLHPFGVVTMVTADVLWNVPTSISDASRHIEDLENQSATVSVGSTVSAATLAGAAGAAADALIATLGVPDGSTWEVADHRLSTVIEGTDVNTLAMPTPYGPVHTALHRLSRGDGVLADPGKAFIAQWSGADFAWAPTRLVYELDAGTSLLASHYSFGKKTGRLGRQHRRMTLLLAHLAASVGLVRAEPAASSPYFHEWAKHAANRMGRLYGPAAPRDWGLEPRTFLANSGAVPEIEAILGTELFPKFDVPLYPAPAPAPPG